MRLSFHEKKDLPGILAFSLPFGLSHTFRSGLKHLEELLRTEFLYIEDPLEKEMATHSSILAWETPWTVAAGGL